MIGWTAGIVVAIVVFTLLSSVIPQDKDGADRRSLVSSRSFWGLLLLFMALRQWRGRPAKG
jgi:hypothetical protein